MLREELEMTIEELIKELQKIEDKTLDVRLEDAEEDYFEEANKWLERVEVHYRGGSGHELYGEVVLVGSE